MEDTSSVESIDKPNPRRVISNLTALEIDKWLKLPPYDDDELFCRTYDEYVKDLMKKDLYQLVSSHIGNNAEIYNWNIKNKTMSKDFCKAFRYVLKCKTNAPGFEAE